MESLGSRPRQKGADVHILQWFPLKRDMFWVKDIFANVSEDACIEAGLNSSDKNRLEGKREARGRSSQKKKGNSMKAFQQRIQKTARHWLKGSPEQHQPFSQNRGWNGKNYWVKVIFMMSYKAKGFSVYSGRELAIFVQCVNNYFRTAEVTQMRGHPTAKDGLKHPRDRTEPVPELSMLALSSCVFLVISALNLWSS